MGKHFIAGTREGGKERGRVGKKKRGYRMGVKCPQLLTIPHVDLSSLINALS